MVSKNGNKHENYEILNLIGYGLSKFNEEFNEEFGFTSKTDFYNFCVQSNIAKQLEQLKIEWTYLILSFQIMVEKGGGKKEMHIFIENY